MAALCTTASLAAAPASSLLWTHRRTAQIAARPAQSRAARGVLGRSLPRGLPHAHPRRVHVASAAEESATAGVTEWFQKTVTLPEYRRGCHVITYELYDALPEISEFEIGMANFFIRHTSASLTLNENASPDVPLDLADTLDRIVPEGNATKGYSYRHLDEGPDDMPAHVKSSLMGPSLSIPVSQGRLALGTWQGIYLNEHRNHGGRRCVVVTIQGVKRADGRSYGNPSFRY